MANRITKTKVFFAALLCLAGMGADAEEVVRRFPAPNGAFTAITTTDATADSGSVLALQSQDAKPVPLWRSYRPVAVHWSPDGRYLAVEDFVAKSCTAVVVFKMGEKPALLYQTPYSDSEYRLAFFFDRWLENGALQIKVIDQETHEVLLSYRQALVEGRPAASANIYKEQGYGLQ